MIRNKLSSLVSRQLPEFVREDYPTFVAFVEAYYEYLEAQGVNLKTLRDIDETLEDFISQFKKELAHNLPTVNPINDERFILSKIKDQYLAKGSQASFELLFKLLFGKKVELFYPGRQLLRASDGRWNQDISLFAKIDFGDPADIVGKLVTIQTPTRIISVLIDRTQNVIGEVDRVVPVDDGIYEFFLDKKFFGIVSPGDIIQFRDSFQATILPTTASVKITQRGRNFKVGQIFQLSSGDGSPALLKITETDSIGGIKYASLIKFGIGYASGFSTTIVADNSIDSLSASGAPTSTLIVTTGTPGAQTYTATINDPLLGFNEQGFISTPDYVDIDYVDGTYAGSTIREFFLNFRNAQVGADEPAVIEVDLGALTRYPGYYTSNNGFLDDSIYNQYSKYYQDFSYVIKIDERLSAYKSAIKTMVHPAGMALFGEYNINNEFDLSVSLESLVKSLGVTLLSLAEVTDSSAVINFDKSVSDSIDTPTDTTRYSFSKQLDTNLDEQLDVLTQAFTKVISPSAGFTEETVQFTDAETLEIGKGLSTIYAGLLDSTVFELDTVLPTETATLTEIPLITTDKYIEPSIIDNITDVGYVVINPYEEGGYFEEVYVNARDAEFSEI
jgi:hypothetical protein